MLQAEAWLREQAQKEGWAKATKLQSRPMSQGLIGIAVNDKSAALIEVSKTVTCNSVYCLMLPTAEKQMVSE